MLKIWVDADACPQVIKEIVYRAATRTQTIATLVANQFLTTPPSQYIQKLQVPGGLDVADQKIVELLEAGDLVITADIPLAANVIEKGGTALNPRGELYTASNIKERLSMRDFSTNLRSSGVQTGGPSPYTKKDIQKFANALDQYLTRYK